MKKLIECKPVGKTAVNRSLRGMSEVTERYVAVGDRGAKKGDRILFNHRFLRNGEVLQSTDGMGAILGHGRREFERAVLGAKVGETRTFVADGFEHSVTITAIEERRQLTDEALAHHVGAPTASALAERIEGQKYDEALAEEAKVLIGALHGR